MLPGASKALSITFHPTKQRHNITHLLLQQDLCMNFTTCASVCSVIVLIKKNQLNALISQIYSWNETTCFGQFLCPSSRVFHCTHSNGKCHTGLLTACEQDQDGTAVYSWNETTCFGHFLCPSSGVFDCTHSNGICHTGLLTACE